MKKFQLFIVMLVLMGMPAMAFPPSAGAAPSLDGTREITFMNGEVRLTGTLFLPEGEGPFPAVVLFHGSGPDTRESYFADAKMLQQAGIIALAYDKRGTGSSTGDWETSSLDDLVADALSGLHTLQTQPEVDPDKVGILGSSQGAYLAPFAAARDDQVAFIVQVTGSATTLANQEMWDDGNSLKQLGFSDRAIATEMKALHMLYSGRDLIRKGILPLGDLWFVYYDPYLDPADVWPNVNAPALVLYGGRDMSVPTRTSLEVVPELLVHPSSRVVVFPDRPHALGGPSRNDDPVYSSLVTGWILAVTNDAPPPEMPFGNQLPDEGNTRWYRVGSQPTRWYNMIHFHLALVILFLLSFLCAVVVGLFSKRNVLARLAFVLTGLVNLAVLVGWGLTVNYLLNADADSASPVLPMGGILPWLAYLSVLLALGLAYLFTRENRRSSLSKGAKFVHGLVVFATLLFLPFLGYWNLLAGRM
ncbi:MAG: alpha/beta fold hydrolase [Chloroflexota bacterium]